ncbi:MAG: Lrp/AsnC family transcriptional regulator [Thermoplasmata archaeon YP2-bin.285]|uniref:Lrp/AsnC family transcriptional regulator n=1 Tax=Candidatus Sysuiplasma superficiale TaxID=2823368 RepID=A0A8J7YLK4_9ARCH|nr:Lrp/AsnC family transcriptional regulator [Candidatus Sysuiplasma superficiale]
MPGGFMFDRIDSELVSILRENSRMPISAIAQRLGVARGTVRQRLSRLEKEGIIRRYTVEIDESKVSDSQSAFVLISFMPGFATQREVARRIASIEGVSELYLISGGWDMIAKISAPGLNDIGNIVIDRLRSMEGVSRTETCSVFSTVKRSVNEEN